MKWHLYIFCILVFCKYLMLHGIQKCVWLTLNAKILLLSECNGQEGYTLIFLDLPWLSPSGAAIFLFDENPLVNNSGSYLSPITCVQRQSSILCSFQSPSGSKHKKTKSSLLLKRNRGFGGMDFCCFYFVVTTVV